MAKVVLGDRVHANQGGVDYYPGDTVEVSDDLAASWVAAGVAEMADKQSDDPAPVKRGPGRPRKDN